MGVDHPGYRCRWVRNRLPLLTGGELTGAERRQVERHLIACPGCQLHEQSMAGALGALRAAASEPLEANADAPSLWPALARQIRESKHEAPSFSTFSVFARFTRPALALAVVLIVMTLAGTGVHAYRRERAADLDQGIAVSDPTFEELVPVPTPVPPPIPSVTSIVESSSPGRQVVANEPASAVPTERAPARFDYDLDHGTPMGPDGSDVKASY